MMMKINHSDFVSRVLRRGSSSTLAAPPVLIFDKDPTLLTARTIRDHDRNMDRTLRVHDVPTTSMFSDLDLLIARPAHMKTSPIVFGNFSFHETMELLVNATTDSPSATKALKKSTQHLTTL